jgi:hypothetical protein
VVAAAAAVGDAVSAAAVAGCWLIDTAVGIAACWSVLLEVAVDAEEAAAVAVCCEAVGCCCWSCCLLLLLGSLSFFKTSFTNAI